jgi:short-subunit dehydrogenase
MPVAIITGASKGIGWSIANRFAENGFDLLMIARDIEGLQARSGELQQRFPAQRVATFSIDLMDKSQLSSLSQFALATLSSMDVLVFNAGLFVMGELLNPDDSPSLDDLMQLHVLSNHYLCQKWQSSFKKGTHIFSICSVVSNEPRFDSPAYSISKVAQLAWTKMLRASFLEREIKVTAVLPGQTLTASWDGIPVEANRILSADAVADAVWKAWEMPGNTVIEEIVIRPQKGDL